VFERLTKKGAQLFFRRKRSPITGTKIEVHFHTVFTKSRRDCYEVELEVGIREVGEGINQKMGGSFKKE